MLGFLAALGSAAGGLAGGGIDAAVSAKMAAQNRQFQERMTRHRYRYQMEDMKAAGLNPMLAFGQSPPGAPGGAMPSMQSPVTSGIQAASALANQKLTAQQARKTSNEADMTAIQAAIAKGLMDQGGKHTGTIDRIIDNMTQGSTGSATAGRSWVEDALGEGVRGWHVFKRLFDGPERDFNSAWEYQTKPRGNQ